MISILGMYGILNTAWFPLRKGHTWAVATLGIAGLPTAITAAWAATVALVNQRDYGYAHPYVWLLTMFWLLGVVCAVWGLLLQRRNISPWTTSFEE